MNLRVLIADDEPLALDGLEIMLREIGDIDLVARCRNGSEAIRDVRRFRPDLAILDIDMPGLSGFDVVATFDRDAGPIVVFSTAHDQFAVRAFGVNASGYLLKPLDDAGLRAALVRVRRQIELRAAADLNAGLPATRGRDRGQPALDRIVVRSPGHVHFLEPREIAWLEACGDYVQVHSDGQSHMVRASLRDLTETLRKYGFCRVHRSATVNTACVRELVATENGDHTLILSDASRVRLSRTFRDDFFAVMSPGSGGTRD